MPKQRYLVTVKGESKMRTAYFDETKGKYYLAKVSLRKRYFAEDELSKITPIGNQYED